MLRESRRTIQTAIKVKRIIAQMINELDREWKQCENLWLQTRQARNTERAYAQALEDFLVSVKIPIWTADYQDFASWREDMVRRGLKGSTINARLGALNTLFNFACNEYLVENESGLQEPLAKHNPLKMKFLTVKVKQYANSRALSVSEIRRLLGSIDQTTDGGMRDYALLLGYLNLGRRNSEWRLARVCDFEMAGNEMFYRWSGKGQVDNIDNVPKKLWQVINRYVAASGGRGIYDYIFLNRFGQPISARGVGRTLEKYVKLARITGKVRVHDLRHTAAMLRRQSGADVEEIREFLRHSSLVTTQIYLHRLERVVDRRAKSVFEMIAG